MVIIFEITWHIGFIYKWQGGKYGLSENVPLDIHYNWSVSMRFYEYMPYMYVHRTEREMGFKPFPKRILVVECPTQLIGLTSLL
jgi:hypothetical protein